MSESGFFDISKNDECRHAEHLPPAHLVIPEGKGYRHVCPACGKATVLMPETYTFNDGKTYQYLKG